MTTICTALAIYLALTAHNTDGSNNWTPRGALLVRFSYVGVFVVINIKIITFHLSGFDYSNGWNKSLEDCDYVTYMFYFFKAFGTIGLTVLRLNFVIMEYEV